MRMIRRLAPWRRARVARFSRTRNNSTGSYTKPSTLSNLRQRRTGQKPYPLPALRLHKPSKSHTPEATGVPIDNVEMADADVDAEGEEDIDAEGEIDDDIY